jgi:hypothetical protein
MQLRCDFDHHGLRELFLELSDFFWNSSFSISCSQHPTLALKIERKPNYGLVTGSQHKCQFKI